MTIDKRAVEARTEDWQRRLTDLYDQVEKALADNPDIHCDRLHQAVLHEAPMEQVNTGPVTLDVLKIYSNRDVTAIFKPVGL